MVDRSGCEVFSNRNAQFIHRALYYFAASLAVPMKISAVAALATVSVAPIAMTTLKPETKDSSIARRISCWVAGS